MSSSTFEEHAKLGDTSNFVAQKVRLEIIADENNVFEYIQGKMLEPSKYAFVVIKKRYKKGESKVKQILAYVLQDHLLAYVGNLKKYKDMYDKIVGMYEVNNLNEIITLKYQLKEMKMNLGEIVQSYIMRIYRLKY